MELLVNKENGNQYRVLGKVGEGAYAEVFKGETLRTREPVAIKKMKHMKKAVLVGRLRTRRWRGRRWS
jgi:serine/threonine protein kinase